MPSNGAPPAVRPIRVPQSVDRIDDPAQIGAGPFVSELLADNAVFGIDLGQGLADCRFRSAVGRSDRIELTAAFVIDSQFGPKMRQYDLGRAFGERVGRGEIALKVEMCGRGHGPWLGGVCR